MVLWWVQKLLDTGWWSWTLQMYISMHACHCEWNWSILGGFQRNLDKRYPLRRSCMYTIIRAWDRCAWDRNWIVGPLLLKMANHTQNGKSSWLLDVVRLKSNQIRSPSYISQAIACWAYVSLVFATRLCQQCRKSYLWCLLVLGLWRGYAQTQPLAPWTTFWRVGDFSSTVWRILDKATNRRLYVLVKPRHACIPKNNPKKMFGK